MPKPLPPAAEESDVGRRRRIAVQIVADALIQMALRARFEELAREAGGSDADGAGVAVPAIRTRDAGKQGRNRPGDR